MLPSADLNVKMELQGLALLQYKAQRKDIQATIKDILVANGSPEDLEE